MGGGGSPQQPTPAPAASMQETSAQAIQAQIDAQPRILEAQKQYGPQFSQLNLEQLQKYGPEFAQAALDLQKKFGPEFAAVERELSPELAGAQKTLSDYLASTDEKEFSELEPFAQQAIRSAQSQRGLGAISPLGAIDEAAQLIQLKQNLKDRRLNIALSTAGRVPIGQMPNIQGQTGTQQLIQAPSSSDLFGYQQGLNSFNASIFGTQGSMYNQQLGAQTARRGQNLDFGADIIGGAASAYGSYAGLSALCWVAAEVFNEPMDGLNVSKVRKFILTDAPSWFREGYIKYGKRVAKFIHDKPILKAILKPLFSWFAKKGEN